jgi:WD40 repeat protein
MLSGDRDGSLAFTDMATGSVVRRCHGPGHATCVNTFAPHTESALLGGPVPSSSSSSSSQASSHPGEEAGGGGGALASRHVFVSGGQNGCVRVHDSRQEQAVANLKLHASAERGTGAVAAILGASSGNVLVSAAADDRICVTETRHSFSR